MEGSREAVNFCRLNYSMYNAVIALDKDFATHGEKPYFFISTRSGFARHISMLRNHRKGKKMPPGWTPYEVNALIGDRGEILCLGELRFTDDCGNITWVGHIGYTVPPSLRGNGYAKIFLKESLKRAWETGFQRVMLTCDITNAASRRVIESCGGDYAGDYTEGNFNKRQYWFYRPEEMTEKERI